MTVARHLTFESAQSAPPVALVAAIVTGWHLQDWIVVLTVIYLVLQVVWNVIKIRRELRGASGRPDD